MDTEGNSATIRLTSQIAAAYLSNHTVPAGEIPTVLRAIYETLTAAGKTPEPVEPVVELKPAVAIKKSVSHDHLICLDCGKSLKMLKRHVNADHGISIEEYRKKWGLKDDYPVVAPAYAKARSELARELGLGKRRLA